MKHKIKEERIVLNITQTQRGFFRNVPTSSTIQFPKLYKIYVVLISVSSLLTKMCTDSHKAQYSEIAHCLSFYGQVLKLGAFGNFYLL